MGEFIFNARFLVASTEGGGHGPNFWGLMLYFGFVIVIIVAMMSVAKKDFKNRVFKNWFAQRFEQLYLFIENLCLGIIGEHGRKYIPMIMTFWMVIFVGNIVALFFPTSPTADLSFNLAMALISVLYVQNEGIKMHADAERAKGRDPLSAWFIGFFKHMSHFSGPRLGGLLAILISPMIFAIEIVSELMKNLSLSLRLFGNIHGGHEAVEAMNHLGEPYFPIGTLLLPIKLLTAVVQALIFCLLTCVYLSLVTDHSHGEEHGHHDEAGEPALAH